VLRASTQKKGGSIAAKRATFDPKKQQNCQKGQDMPAQTNRKLTPKRCGT
jgi:hypothetical protein